MKADKEAILAALAESRGERVIAAHLKKHPILLIAAFGSLGNHGNYVLSEFGLGKKYRADFVHMSGSSAGWSVEMIELEPVNDPIYNRDGTPSRRLSIAQRQIAEWKDYQRTDDSTLRRELADATKHGDLVGRSSDNGDPCTMSNQRLRDPESYVQYSYTIVIGRRELLTIEAQRLRSRATHLDHTSIATYDRLVDAAEIYGTGLFTR